ncbi:hypothetical protein [Bauldia litoralis]|uniref:hypothetical protein n=1 Tax=Bauldia litoralis TaxID=665467 RepID=UPI001113AFDF|nr:hypothetical protein [Bauldia litoralis]
MAPEALPANFQTFQVVDLGKPRDAAAVFEVVPGTVLTASIGGISARTTVEAKTIPIRVEPVLDKSNDAAWTVRLAVDIEDLPEAVFSLTDRLGAWRSPPLTEPMKDRLRKEGGLTVQLDDAVFEGTGFWPYPPPVALVAIDRATDIADLYGWAKDFDTKAKQYSRTAAAAVRMLREVDQAISKAERTQDDLEAVEQAGLPAAVASMDRLYIRLQEARNEDRLAGARVRDFEEAITQQKDAIATANLSFVDPDGNRSVDKPEPGMEPLETVLGRTRDRHAQLASMLRRQYEDRFASGDPEITSLQQIEKLISENPQIVELAARLARLEAFEKQRVSLVGELTAEIDRLEDELPVVRERASETTRQLRQARAGYEDTYRRVVRLARTLPAPFGPPPDLSSSSTPPSVMSTWYSEGDRKLKAEADAARTSFNNAYVELINAEAKAYVMAKALAGTRIRAIQAACVAIASFGNKDMFDDVVSEIGKAIDQIKYLSDKADPSARDVVTREVLRDSFVKLLEARELLSDGPAKRLTFSAAYASRSLDGAGVAVNLANAANAWRKNDPVAIAHFLEAASSAVDRVPLVKGAKYYLLTLALSTKASINWANGIKDKKMLEALEAVRQRPEADRPTRRLYTRKEIENSQYYSSPWSSEEELDRLTTVFQAQFILGLAGR